MSQEREYIIILKNANDLDQFYDDMESRYGDNEIPNRVVECAYRRPMSRATHYYLSDQEAQQVALDSRVQSIDLPYHAKNMVPTPLETQSGSIWNKSGTNSSEYVNWGLLRGYERTQRANWGSDGTPTVSGSISLNEIGRDVDVVIMDGHLVAGHPEWATNLDGSGATRFNQFNWFQYNQEVRGVAAGTYVYDLLPEGDGDNNHGNNVASIAAGSSNGWARGANIYNIRPYSSNSANNYTNYVYDVTNYIRVWHANKPINPRTGRKNPTVVNMSWGFTSGLDISIISKVRYQGVEYNQPVGGWTTQDRINFDMVAASGSTILWMSRDGSIDADMTDAINDGIIMVGAAGNLFMYVDKPGGINYDNAFIYLYFGVIPFPFPYMQGPSPGASPGVICVSAIRDTVSERKGDYSNAGPRTDIFAAGTNVAGAVYNDASQVDDARNSAFKRMKMTGTSMASPQVCGLIACGLETYPWMSAAQALQFITTTATQNQLYDLPFSTSYGAANYLSYDRLYNGPNKFAAYQSQRVTQAQVYPKKDYFVRPNTGKVYPRSRVRRYG